jgi:glycosyltransferase involved in cell wall biosynthesis
VIVPTYKRPDLLRRCLAALTPEFQGVVADRYEVIVTNDGDASGGSQTAIGVLPNLVCTEGPGKGPAANRNHGAALAKGQWLVFTDDDCIPSPAWLYAFAKAVRPGCLVYEGRTTCAAGLRSALEHAPVNEAGGHLWSCNFMVEAPLFRSCGGFDEGFPFPAMEDVDFRERLRDIDVTWDFVSGAVVDHPPRNVSLSQMLAQQESYYYFSIAKRRLKPRLMARLLFTARLRSRAFLRPDWCAIPRAAYLLVAELVIISLCHGRWCGRFSRRPTENP